jgi:hypothetical protein
MTEQGRLGVNGTESASWQQEVLEILVREVKSGNRSAIDVLGKRNFARGYLETLKPGQTPDGLESWFEVSVDAEYNGSEWGPKYKALLGAAEAVASGTSSLSKQDVKGIQNRFLDKVSDGNRPPRRG